MRCEGHLHYLLLVLHLQSTFFNIIQGETLLLKACKNISRLYDLVYNSFRFIVLHLLFFFPFKIARLKLFIYLFVGMSWICYMSFKQPKFIFLLVILNLLIYKKKSKFACWKEIWFSFVFITKQWSFLSFYGWYNAILMCYI